LEESVSELAGTEKVTASLAGIKIVHNGVLITVIWTVRSGIEFETVER
jgi:hypothetical protein